MMIKQPSVRFLQSVCSDQFRKKQKRHSPKILHKHNLSLECVAEIGLSNVAAVRHQKTVEVSVKTESEERALPGQGAPAGENQTKIAGKQY